MGTRHWRRASRSRGPYKELKEHVAKVGEIEWRNNTGWIVLKNPPCFDHPVDRYRIYDPYRKLKEAHANGAKMYIRLKHGKLISCDPYWTYAPEAYCFKY